MAVNQVKRNGSYAPLSANYYDDDAIIAAGERAEVLFTRGLAFCARTLNDGFISDLQLTTFRLSSVKSRAARLVEVGVWERVEPGLFGNDGAGYRVVRWPKWNLTRAEIEAKQKKDAERKGGGTR
jgi:hypothetical protein